MLIFDAHLDLAMNALEWNRDLTWPIEKIRQREQGMTDKPDRCQGTVCLPEMRQGEVALCVATQIARIEHNSYSPVFGWRSQEQAWGRWARHITARAFMPTARMRPADSIQRDASCSRKWADWGSSSMQRISVTTVFGRRLTSSAVQSGPAIRTAGHSYRTTGSLPMNKSRR